MRQTVDFGIDLGTTNSAIAVSKGPTVEIFKNNEGEECTPSALHINRKGRLIVTGFGMYGVVVLLISASPGFAVTLALLVLVGFANVLFFVSNVTLSQEVTPPALRARVFGARTALLHLTWLPMIVISGGLAEGVPVQAVFFAAGAFTVLVALVGSLFRSIRDVP